MVSADSFPRVTARGIRPGKLSGVTSRPQIPQQVPTNQAPSAERQVAGCFTPQIADFYVKFAVSEKDESFMSYGLKSFAHSGGTQRWQRFFGWHRQSAGVDLAMA